MDSTLKMMRHLITEETNKLTLEEIAEEYQEEKQPELLASAYSKVFRLVIAASNNYYGLAETDIASYTLEKLDESLQTYNGGAKFSTYFRTVMSNKFREETQALNTHKRKVIFHSNSYDTMVENGYDIAQETEIKIELEGYGLSEREKKYCMYMMAQETNQEAAEHLGVSTMALTKMRRRLRRKLSNYGL